MELRIKLIGYYKKIMRKVLSPFIIKKPTKNKYALLTNNCLGGMLYHDWKLEFCSPTINLQMHPDTFLNFCENLPESLDWDFEEIKLEESKFDLKYVSDENRFPVGRFKGGEVYFQHYHSFEEAIKAWHKRADRLHEFMKNGGVLNIAILCDSVSPNTYERFKRLPYNKVLLVREKMDAFDEAIVLKQMGVNNVWYEYRKGLSVKKYYEEFNFAKWIE